MSAAPWFRKMREILAGPGQSPEWVAFSAWWEQQKPHQRQAWYYMAGIPWTATVCRAWGDIPDKYRAALVVAINAARVNLAGIGSALDVATPSAMHKLRPAA